MLGQPLQDGQANARRLQGQQRRLRLAAGLSAYPLSRPGDGRGLHLRLPWRMRCMLHRRHGFDRLAVGGRPPWDAGPGPMRCSRAASLMQVMALPALLITTPAALIPVAQVPPGDREPGHGWARDDSWGICSPDAHPPRRRGGRDDTLM